MPDESTAPDVASDDAPRDEGARRPAPRERGARHGAGRPLPLSVVLSAWAPVAAGVLRSTAGLVMFTASLLTLPVTMATPFLTGVSLVMLVGGVAATAKACRDADDLRRFGRVFPLVAAGLAGVAIVVTVVVGPGVWAPQLRGPPPPTADDGAIRFAP